MDERDKMPQATESDLDPELEVLGELLDQLDEAGAMDLEELDGFFAALHCAPDEVLPSDYMPEVVGDGFTNEEIFPNDDAMRLFLNLVRHHWMVVAEAFAANDFEPLLLEDQEGQVHGNNWAIGFMRGLDMRHEEWRGLLDAEEEFQKLMPILALANEMHPDPEHRIYKEPISAAQREQLLERMSTTVAQLYQHFAPQRKAAAQVGGVKQASSGKIGRNDPCYCGSGKKYKKCCGGLPVN